MGLRAVARCWRPALGVAAMLFGLVTPGWAALTCDVGDLLTTCEVNTPQDVAGEAVNVAGHLVIATDGVLDFGALGGSLTVGGTLTVDGAIRANGAGGTNGSNGSNSTSAPTAGTGGQAGTNGGTVVATVAGATTVAGTLEAVGGRGGNGGNGGNLTGNNAGSGAAGGGGGAGGNGGGFVLLVGGDLSLATTAAIDAAGGRGGNGGHGGTSGNPGHGGAGGHGGPSGVGGTVSITVCGDYFADGDVVEQQFSVLSAQGGGGGKGGNGGTARGSGHTGGAGGNSPDGGSGGAIVLNVDGTVTIHGIMNALGGNGLPGGNGGNGSQGAAGGADGAEGAEGAPGAITINTASAAIDTTEASIAPAPLVNLSQARRCTAEGCSHGFWKNRTAAWPAPYAPATLASAVFTNLPPAFASTTLLDALSLNGGSTIEGAIEILLKQAVAALLNAASGDVDFPRTVDGVIDDVNAALASGDRDQILALKDALDTDNNLGCPLE